MNGAEAAAWVVGQDRVRVTRSRDCYHPGTRTIFLLEGTCRCTEPGAVFRALHEAAHARQHLERPVWFALRNVRFFRLWIERDAWRRAEEWMRILGFEPGIADGERETGLRSYLHTTR